MNVYVAALVAALGVVLLLAGVQGSGSNLFTSIFGTTPPAGSSSSSSGTPAGAVTAGYPQHPVATPHPVKPAPVVST